MRTKRIRWIGRVLLTLLIAGIFLLPILWNLFTALKSTQEILQIPPTLLPQTVSWDQFTKIAHAGDGIFLRYISNSATMALLSVVLVIVVSSLCSYGLAILPFPGSNALFFVILSILMVPFQALMIPLYRLLSQLHLVNTKGGLILVYSTFFLPFCVFMMRNYFASLPASMRESALLDGARDTTILVRLYLPLSIPAIATVIVFVFLETWNDFILSLVFSNSNVARNVQVGIMNFGKERFQNDWGIINAGAFVAAIPPVAIFLALQKHYVKGMTSGFSK